MGQTDVAEAWDRCLREGDWARARELLTDDATYVAVPPLQSDAPCTSPDQIIDRMRHWKGQLPDVEVVAWGTVGECVVAWLRQPFFRHHAGWYQVIVIRDGRVAGLTDFATREEAAAAAFRQSA